MRALHFVFRATGSQIPLSTRDAYLILWNQLCSRLDRCNALVLMPNHGHLLVPETDRSQAEKAIRLSLFAFKRRVPSFWDPLPEPKIVLDLKHLRRQIRYIHLNPCRSQFTKDPLCWEFSTHWDFLGYTAGSISVPSVRSLGFSSHAQFHEFVSSDSTTDVSGTPLPPPVARSNHFPIATLDRVADLSLLLTRSSPSQLGKASLARRLFYSLASAAGYKNKTQLSKYLNISQQSVSEFLKRGRAVDYSETQATRLLSDPRLAFKILCKSQEKR
jgi:hypothetical protein